MDKAVQFGKVVLTFIMLFSIGQAAAQALDSTRIMDPILASGNNFKPRRFTTQMDISMGSAVILKKDRSETGFNGGVKGIYNATGAIYVCSGISMTYLKSKTKAPDLVNVPDGVINEASLVSIPAGIGFTMGDDRAGIMSGINFLPSLYLRTPAGTVAAHSFTMGIEPEFGFFFKAGRHNQRGMQIGMIGKLQLWQPASRNDGYGFRYGFAGAGAVIRF